MIHYLPNPMPGTFSRNLFDQIINNIKPPVDAALAWCLYPLNATDNAAAGVKFTEPVVVVAVTDNYLFDPEYDHWTGQPEPKEFEYFRQLADANPDKTFVLLLTGNYYTAQHFLPLTNIRVVNWHVLQEDDSYPDIRPVEKNFASEQIGISLNRQARQHRLALISLLYGLGLNKYTHISAVHLYKQLDKLPSTDFLDHNYWQFAPEHSTVRELVIQGFEQVAQGYLSGDLFQQPAEDVYPLTPGTQSVVNFDNRSNFERLRPWYENSFVEFVACRLYIEPTMSIDEKFINSVYAQNFPVIIGTAGTVSFYRSAGFDMFDDVVDHSYDTISNPISRLEQAVLLNQHLLTDAAATKQLWQNCRARFAKNLANAGENMYNWYRTLALKECNQQIPDLLKEPFNVNQL